MFSHHEATQQSQSVIAALQAENARLLIPLSDAVI